MLTQGCVTNSENIGDANLPSTTASASGEPTALKSPNLPTVPQTVTPTIAASGTPSFDLKRLDQFMFTSVPTADCKLPCWEELVIGQSTEEDIQEWAVANIVSNLSSTPLTGEPQGIIGFGHAWSNLPATFAMRFWVEEETHILRNIGFYWDWTIPNVMSPQRIIQELGTPSEWYVTFQGIPLAHMESVMIYEQGFYFRFSSLAQVNSIDEDSDGSLDRGQVEFCLNSTDTHGQANIGSPVSTGALVPFQLEWRLGYRDLPRTTIQELSGLSLDEVARQALQSSCIDLERQYD
jgi:hypothetical protein